MSQQDSPKVQLCYYGYWDKHDGEMETCEILKQAVFLPMAVQLLSVLSPSETNQL